MLGELDLARELRECLSHSLSQVRSANAMEEEKSTTGGSDDWTTGPGVGDLWTEVNHVAIVVTDVGRSLHFYTDVVGMKQVMRPDFDR